MATGQRLVWITLRSLEDWVDSDFGSRGFVHASPDEAFEKGMWAVGFALEFWMKLAGNVKRVIFNLNHFHQIVFQGRTADHESCLFE